MKSIEHSRGELELPTFKFGWYSSAFSLSDGYDNNGNRLHVRESFGATNYDYTYTYDTFSRLVTSATTVNGDVDVDYAYDDAGNITSRTRGAAETDYTLNYKNQVTLADATSDTYFCYDGAGNMSYEGASISCPPNSGQQTHWWDYRDRLVQWGDAKFVYDPSSQRVREDNGDVFYYLWDGGNPIAKYDSDGNALEFYLYGADADNLIAKWEVASEKRYDYFRDGVNSVARVVNASDDTIDAVYRYEPYGALQPSSDSVVDRYAYTGREACEVDGHTMLYYRARWYDSTLGRFATRDLAPAMGRSSPYVYAAANPVRFKDPLGLKEVCSQDVINSWEASPPNGGSFLKVRMECPCSWPQSSYLKLDRPVPPNPGEVWAGVGSVTSGWELAGEVSAGVDAGGVDEDIPYTSYAWVYAPIDPVKKALEVFYAHFKVCFDCPF